MLRIIFFLSLSVLALSININCDNYINLPPKGITFNIQTQHLPYRLNVTGLPQGLAVKDNSIVPVSVIESGQYIVGVKAIDSANQTDEKIIILNIESNVFSNQVIETVQPRMDFAITTANASQTDMVHAFQVDNSQSNFRQSSSISSEFNQPSSNFVETSSNQDSNDVNSLKQFFSQVQVNTVTSSQSSSDLNLASNNLSDILSGFSNSSQNGNSQTNDVKQFMPTQQLQVKNLVNLTQTDAQKQQIILSNAQAQAIFQQQKLAAQYVASNYSQVQQLTANKNMANEMIVNITKQYQTDQTIHKQIYADLDVASNNKSKIESAMSNLNIFITNVSASIKNSIFKIQDWSEKRVSVLTLTNQSTSQSTQITQTIQIINGQLSATNNAFTDNQKICQGLNSNLLQTNKSISILSLQSGLLAQQIDDGIKDSTAKQAKVDDLMRQLADAQKILKLSVQNVANLKIQQGNLTNQMSSAKTNLTMINLNVNSCRQKSSSYQSNIQVLQTNLTASQNALTQISNKKDVQVNTITSIDSQLAQQQSNYNTLKTQLASGNSALAVLQQALPAATQTLNILFQKKQQSDLNIQTDEDSLNAAIARYKSQTSALQMATMNLQNARAISQKCDQAVNNLLFSKGNILPYAVAVSSPQKALIGQTIVNPSINISNWFNFLTANYGQAAYAFANQDVSSLYKISSSNLKSNIACPNEDSLHSFTGKIMSVKTSNEIVVKIDADNSNQTLQIPECAQLFSNVPQYVYKAGDSVIVKGQCHKSYTTVRSLICLNQ